VGEGLEFVGEGPQALGFLAKGRQGGPTGRML
jgi:hypothetical protein